MSDCEHDNTDIIGKTQIGSSILETIWCIDCGAYRIGRVGWILPKGQPLSDNCNHSWIKQSDYYYSCKFCNTRETTAFHEKNESDTQPSDTLAESNSCWFNTKGVCSNVMTGDIEFCPYGAIKAELICRGFIRNAYSQPILQSEAQRTQRAEVQSEPCSWQEDESFGTTSWDTECGNKHIFDVDGPEENKHTFCPYCGKKIRAEYINWDDEKTEDSDGGGA